MLTLDYQIVDVFTDRAFAGNALAVVLDGNGLSTQQMQAIAREFNLSETTFPMSSDSADADYRVRIFTPTVELPFAGHPSLGTAWVLTSLGRLSSGLVRQSCGAGIVAVEIEPGPGKVTLSGAAPHAGPELDPEPLLAACGLARADLAGPATVAGTGIDFAYLPVNADAVARAKPLADGAPADATGLYVYAYADGRVHARMFAAGAGVTEDPATGSAALGLGVHLVATGRANGDGRTSFTVSQGAEVGRPSTLHCEVQAAGGVATGCRVSGGVVPVASGRITASPG